MMNSSSEMVKETSSDEMMAGATIGSVTRRNVPKARFAEVGRRLLQAAVETFEAGDQHRDRIGHADQHMAEHDREQRQAEAELQQHDQQRDGDDDLRQHQRRHDQAADRALAGEAVARHGARRADAEDRGEDRGGDADDQAVFGGVDQRRRLRQVARTISA